MKVAIVHDWLTGMRGGEAVLEAIAELYPGAPIHTLIAFPEALSPGLRARPIVTTWMQRLPGVRERYRHFLPLMPFAIESLDLSAYDLVVSSSHCVAKGVRKREGAFHACYIHAPMRYMWDRFGDYFSPAKSGWITRTAARMLRPWFQRWDRRSSRGVDLFVANSGFIASQVGRIYQRPAQVLHPFASLSRFLSSPRRPDLFYLMVGAFAPYKRVDLAIEAFNQLGLPLWIVGSGQEEARLRAMAGPTIRFFGSADDETVSDLYSRCRAFVFPGVEDFGITPLEAMASGAPVIAFAEGGALETVTPETGVFFAEQTVHAIEAAIRQVESPDFQAGAARREWACRSRAAAFEREAFKERFGRLVEKAMQEKATRSRPLPWSRGTGSPSAG